MNSSDQIFYLSIMGGIIGFLGVVAKYCSNSRCRSISIGWSGIEIIRDVVLENEEAHIPQTQQPQQRQMLNNAEIMV